MSAGTDHLTGDRPRIVVVGGSGFVGTHVAEHLVAAGRPVTIIDRVPPHPRVATRVDHVAVDLLCDRVDLPSGDVVLAAGIGDPRVRWAWTLPVQIVAATARLAPLLAQRAVHLTSTLEVYGTAPGPLTETTPGRLPWSDERLRSWIGELDHVDASVGPWAYEPWARRLLDADPSGRWAYGMAKRAQELVLADVVDPARLWMWRLANVVAPGQERVVARLARRAAEGRDLEITEGVRRSFLPAGHVGRLVADPPPAGTYVVGAESITLDDLAREVLKATDSSSRVRTRPAPAEDSSGKVEDTALDALGLGVDPVAWWLADTVRDILDDPGPVAHPPIEVVVPPRPVRPATVAARQADALWNGRLKNGQQWSQAVTERLEQQLDVGSGRRVLATTSGTDALRIACGALCGPAVPGEVAVLPTFTFPATAEVLLQLGYRLRAVDVDPRTWTVDPDSLVAALAPGDVRLVVAVDTFGNPCDYGPISAICRDAGVRLVADSAASLGSRVDGRPVAHQADAHTYSMSFAKVVSAGGAGGAVVLDAEVDVDGPQGWTRSALMNELHAVVALDQLEVLDDLVARRHLVADVYTEACGRLGLDHQHVRAGDTHSWVHFAVRIPDGRRDRVAARLRDAGIGTKAYFVPVDRLGVPVERRTTPVTDRLGDEALALPMSSELNEEAADMVCVALTRALR